MINLIVKNIRIFLLMLAASVFNAHMFIPHDHHQSDADICQLPFSDSGKSHHRNFPVHCHAFNDLSAEKAIAYYILHIQNLCSDGITEETYINDPRISWLRYVEVPELRIKTNTPDQSDLRAPPAIS